MVERIEKPYPDNYRLKEQEITMESEKLIKGFADLFKDDLDVQRALAAMYFNCDSGLDSWRTTVSFNKGLSKYTVERRRERFGSPVELTVTRTAEGSKEILMIGVHGLHGSFESMLENRSKGIRYGSHNLLYNNNGSAVQGGRELLAKAQKDFGKV